MLVAKNKENEIVFADICERVAKELKIEGRGFLEVVFSNQEKIRKINKLYREKDNATDVLSFPFIKFDTEKKYILTKKNHPDNYHIDEDAVFLGTVVICEEVAKKQAEQIGQSFEKEIEYLFLHGLLHLLGFDHEIDDGKMRSVEKACTDGDRR